MNQTTNTTASIDLDKLEALASAATPGPWAWWSSNSVKRITGADGRDGGVLHAYSFRDGADVSCSPSNQAFIAAANPSTVLHLIQLARRSTSGSDALEYRTCCEHPDCSTCAGRGGFYRCGASGSDGTAAADELYGYVLKTGHGNKFIETLVNVHPEVRHMWKPVYVKVAAPAPAAQDERDVKDAARYRWLRDVCPEFEAMASPWLYDDLDKAIDAAMSQSKTQEDA